MADEPGLAPPGVDAGRANPARVYDYWLGGCHNFPADRELGAAISALDPVVPAGARANRAFLGRAVRFLAGAGIRQFLDIGSGLPAAGNVHEIARQADPDARVAYVDADPAVTAHSRAILGGDRNTAAVQADVREPGQILGDPAVRRIGSADGGQGDAGARVAGRGFLGRAPAGPGRPERRLPELLLLGHRQARGAESRAAAVPVPQGRAAGGPVHPQRPVRRDARRPAAPPQDRGRAGPLVPRPASAAAAGRRTTGTSTQPGT